MTAPSPSAPVAWRLVPVEPTEAMFSAALATNEPFHPCAVWDAMLAASPAPSMVGLREKVARVIYDDLEGPVANQDFGRQQRQWEQCLRIADQCLALLAREGV